MYHGPEDERDGMLYVEHDVSIRSLASAWNEQFHHHSKFFVIAFVTSSLHMLVVKQEPGCARIVPKQVNTKQSKKSSIPSRGY
jgi:hypothetical protein